MVLVPGVLLTAVVSIVLFLALCAALVLVVIGMRRPATMPLVAAGVLVVLCLAVVAVVLVSGTLSTNGIVPTSQP